MTEAASKEDYEVGLVYQRALDKLRIVWNFTSQSIFYKTHPQVEAPKTEARNLALISENQKAFEADLTILKNQAPKGSYWNA